MTKVIVTEERKYQIADALKDVIEKNKDNQTQKQLSSKMGVDNSYVSSIKNKNTTSTQWNSDDTFLKIENYLQKIGYLKTQSSEKTDTTDSFSFAPANTSIFKTIEKNIVAMLDKPTIMAISVPNGFGKTFAAEQLQIKFHTEQIYLIKVNSRSSETEILTKVANSMLIERYYSDEKGNKKKKTNYSITEEIKEKLIKEKGIIIFDESETASGGSIKFLHHLIDALYDQITKTYKASILILGVRLSTKFNEFRYSKNASIRAVGSRINSARIVEMLPDYDTYKADVEELVSIFPMEPKTKQAVLRFVLERSKGEFRKIDFNAEDLENNYVLEFTYRLIVDMLVDAMSGSNLITMQKLYELYCDKEFETK